MLRPLLLVSGMIFIGAASLTWETQAAMQETPAKNPVQSTPEGQARAKKQYGFECEMCHGATGDGQTDIAKDMKLALTNLADPKTLEGKTDGEIFDLIKKGKGQMTGEGDRMKTDEIWNLVTYVRALAKK
jgi:mono/diheme cytochrome c family protein